MKILKYIAILLFLIIFSSNLSAQSTLEDSIRLLNLQIEQMKLELEFYKNEVELQKAKNAIQQDKAKQSQRLSGEEEWMSLPQDVRTLQEELLEAKKRVKIAENSANKYKMQLEAEIALAKSKQKATEASQMIRLNEYEEALKNVLEAYEALKIANKNSDSEELKIVQSVVYQALNNVNEELTNSFNNNVYIIHPRIGKLLRINEATGRMVFTARGTYNNLIYIFKNYDDKNDRQIIEIDEEVRDIEFSPDGNFLIACTANENILAWKYHNEKLEYEPIRKFGKKTDLSEHQIQSIVITEYDFEFMLGLASKDKVSLYRLSKDGALGELIQEINIKNRGIVFSPYGKRIAIIKEEGAVVYSKSKLNDEKPFFLLKKIELPNTISARFSMDENWIALGSKDGILKIFDLSRMKVLCMSMLHKSSITDIMFTSKKVITCSLDRTIKMFDFDVLKTNERIHPIEISGHNDWIWEIQYNIFDKQLYSISQDKSIRRWSVDIDLLYQNLKEGQKQLEETEDKN